MVVIGKDGENNVVLGDDIRTQGLYIIGSTGTGKSECLSGLALQDIHAGHGCAIVDPHGDLLQAIIARIPKQRISDVIYLDLLQSDAPFGLNLFECVDPTDSNEVALRVSFVQHVFERVWSASTGDTPRLSEVLRNVSYTLISNGLTLAEFPLLLMDSTFRQSLVRNVKNKQVGFFWKKYESMKPSEQEEYRASTFNKIDSFLTFPLLRNIVGQAQTSIPMKEIMDSGKILLVKLSPRLEEITTLVGTTLIGMLLDAAYARSEVPREQRKFFAVYIDEAHRFSGADIAVLLAEARKFNLACTIAHQFRSQLSVQLRGATHNAESKMVFRIAAEDKDDVAAIFDATPPLPEMNREELLIPRQNVLSHLLNYGHEDSRITDFVSKYLAPIDLASKFSPEMHGDMERVNGIPAVVYPHVDCGKCRYRYIPTDLQKGMLALNELFYHAMTGLTIDDERMKEWFRESAYRFAYFLGFPHYHDGEVRKKWDREPVFDTPLVTNGWKALFALQLSNHIKWPKDTIPFKLSIEHLVIRLRMQRTGDLKFHRIDQYPELFRFWYFGYYDFPKTGKPIRNADAGAWFGLYDHTEVFKLAQQIRNEEEARWEAFASAVIKVTEALTAIPIFKGGGQWVTRKGIQQTYADVGNQIGNELVSLPRFTARCKINNQEYTIKTVPLPPIPTGVNLPARLADIQAQNIRDGYLRPVEEVTQEIEARREAIVPPITRKQPL